MNENEILNGLKLALEKGNFKETLAAHISKYAISTGKTKRDFVKAVSVEAGIDPTTVSAIINGKIKRPPTKRLEAVATILSK